MLSDAEAREVVEHMVRRQREADIDVILKFARPFAYHAGGMVGALREAPLVTDDVRTE